MVDEGNPMEKSDDGSRAYSLCAAKLSSANAYYSVSVTRDEIDGSS